jgi:hypothetical protein
VKRLLLALLPITVFAAAPVNDWSPNVTTSFVWNNNITNGEAVWDRIGTLQVTMDALSSSQRVLTRTDTLHGTLHLSGDWVPRFQALDRAVGGVRGDWQHTFGSNEFAPVFTVEAGGDGIFASETARRGMLATIALKLSKQLGAGWRANVGERLDRYDAKRSVFDSGSSETALEIGRDVNDETRFTLTGRWRDGDVLTYAQYDRPDLQALAHDTRDVSTFHRPMTAYAINAKTTAIKAALIHATSEVSAMVLSYEYAVTKHTGLQFEDQTVALSFIRQF